MIKSTLKTPNFDRIDPSVCLNAKLRKLHRLVNQAYQARINSFGLKGSMLSILFIIGKKKMVGQGELAKMLVLEQSTVSRDLKRLSEKGWVSHKIGADARQKLFVLTRAGYMLLEKVSPVWEDLHHNVEMLLGGFNVKNIDNLIHAVESSIDEIKS